MLPTGTTTIGKLLYTVVSTSKRGVGRNIMYKVVKKNKSKKVWGWGNV